MTPSDRGSGLLVRAHAACEWIAWTAAINALWWIFTVAGLVVLGAAPATAAAAALTRRRLRGEAFPTIREFAVTWRRELLPANAVLLPPLAAAAALTAGVLWPGAPIAYRIAAGIALVIASAVLAVLVPMHAGYDLPLRAYLPTAARWASRNLAHVAVLLLVPIVVGTAMSIVPGAIPFFAIGALLVLNAALGGACFAANERALAATP